MFSFSSLKNFRKRLAIFTGDASSSLADIVEVFEVFEPVRVTLSERMLEFFICVKSNVLVESSSKFKLKISYDLNLNLSLLIC